jgi:hypothetical protein
MTRSFRSLLVPRGTYSFSPAGMAIASRFSDGGSGHVVYGLKAHGGL